MQHHDNLLLVLLCCWTLLTMCGAASQILLLQRVGVHPVRAGRTDWKIVVSRLPRLQHRCGDFSRGDFAYRPFTDRRKHVGLHGRAPLSFMLVVGELLLLHLEISVEGSSERDRTWRCGSHLLRPPLLEHHVAALVGADPDLCRFAASFIERHAWIDTKTQLPPTVADGNPKLPLLRASVGDDQTEAASVCVDSGRALLLYGERLQSISGSNSSHRLVLSTHHFVSGVFFPLPPSSLSPRTPSSSSPSLPSAPLPTTPQRHLLLIHPAPAFPR